jgi:hypothetical protein
MYQRLFWGILFIVLGCVLYVLYCIASYPYLTVNTDHVMLFMFEGKFGSNTTFLVGPFDTGFTFTFQKFEPVIDHGAEYRLFPKRIWGCPWDCRS